MSKVEIKEEDRAVNMSVADLRLIVAAGGGIVVNAAGYTAADLRLIAASAKASNAHVIIKNAGSKPSSDLRLIAAAGGGNVIFDFT